ncbi:MAG: tRNA 2-thiouridine(34) synthase MnmA [Candidatus Nomurabacteria bacterium]|nr:tRNA 2-thiouridine(34) synthase MnmA [Candidatus Nomurabacteria bacterium]
MVKKTNKNKNKTARGEKRRTVFVGMSGGVDSSVTAALLKDQGYDVVGVFIKTWHPDFLVCTEEDERRDAMRVAAHLDIPFLTFDFEKEYKEGVADYMISEYKKGRTPNPDVMCNREVKFGAFLKKALSMGADFVATGHYAQNKNNSLLKGNDPMKDQSYFLWTLTPEQIKHVMFPVGHLPKPEVRKLAKKFKLPVAEKKDSQGICFLGAVDIKVFLKHYIKSEQGKVLNEKGEEIGYHDGAVFYTLGERHGFTITKKGNNDSAYYVVEKDIKNNILIVSEKKSVASKSTNISLLGNFSARASRAAQGFSQQHFSFPLISVNWISQIPEEGKIYQAQVRYHGEFLNCKLSNIKNSIAIVSFEKEILVAPGQSIVFYDGDVCLGGGIKE